jgi:hypothetical protein
VTLKLSDLTNEELVEWTERLLRGEEPPEFLQEEPPEFLQ